MTVCSTAATLQTATVSPQPALGSTIATTIIKKYGPHSSTTVTVTMLGKGCYYNTAATMVRPYQGATMILEVMQY
eukprot:5126531-Pyramimonas_sp.AAC.1